MQPQSRLCAERGPHPRLGMVLRSDLFLRLASIAQITENKHKEYPWKEGEMVIYQTLALPRQRKAMRRYAILIIFIISSSMGF